MSKKGFTLAEVLITLSIIGVVAALTVPTLVRNYQDAVNNTKAKKAYSQVVQAWSMYVMDNGGNVAYTFTNVFDLSNKFLKNGKYFRSVKTQQYYIKDLNLEYGYNYTGSVMPDGIFIGLSESGADSDCTTNNVTGFCAYGIIDVNGQKGPNQVGYDCFHFSLHTNKVTPLHPSYEFYEDPNTLCIEPGPGGNGGWSNIGHGCLMRILQNKPKWSG